MAKYKVGDRVVVRRDIMLGKVYFMDGHQDSTDHSFRDSVIHPMVGFAGKTVTISAVGSKYTIEEDSHNWTDGMFSGLAEQPIPTLRTGMVVRTRDGKYYGILRGRGEGKNDYLASSSGTLHLKDYDPKTGEDCDDRVYDIMEVYNCFATFFMGEKYKQIPGALTSIWRRVEPKKMTLAEIENALGYAVEVTE